MHLKINTDGASRGNPGPAAYGFVIKDEKNKIIYKEGQAIGVKTNNVAEYYAVLKALEYVSNNLNHENNLIIDIITDSQLIANQLSGNFKIKNPNLKILFDQIKILEMEFKNIFYQNVPRAKNWEADEMANQALDKI